MPNTPPDSEWPPRPALSNGSDSGSDSQLSKLSPTYPSRHAWFHFFDKALLIIGAVALVLAVVFFIAYNWANMGKLGKFSLVEGVLSLNIIGYVILAYQRRFQLAQQLSLLVACILTGSLLALFGQTYQTGADTWQLFFNWALLITPWVLIARLPALWLLWLALINISIPLFINTTGFLFQTLPLDIHFYDHQESLNFILLTLVNGIALVVWVAMMGKQPQQPIQPKQPIQSIQLKQQSFTKQLFRRKHHWSIYLLGAVATYFATRSGILAINNYGTTLSIALNLMLWLAFIGYLYWRFRRQQIDLLMLTYGCFSVITIILFWISPPLLSHGNNEAGLLLLTLLISGMSAGSVFWLRSLMPETTSPSTPESVTATEPVTVTKPITATEPSIVTESSDTLPWYLYLLIGLGGLLSGLFMIGFIALILIKYIEYTTTQFIVGFVLLAVAVFIYHALRKQPASTQVFISSIALPYSIAGQLFLAYAFYDILYSEPQLVAIIMLMQLPLYVMIKEFLHRLLSALVALACLIWLLSYFHAPEVTAPLLALLLTVFSVQADQFLSLIAPQKQALVHALFRPLSHASMLLLLTISVLFISAEYGHGIANNTTEFYYHYPLAQGLLIAVSLYATHLLLGRYRIGLTSKTGMIIASAVVILGILSVYVSGLLAACLVLVIAKANQQKNIMALAITALVGYIFWYYYQLDTTLLVKSFSMLAVGVALLLTHWILKRHYDSNNINNTEKEHGL